MKNTQSLTLFCPQKQSEVPERGQIQDIKQERKFCLGRRWKQASEKRIIQEVIVLSYHHCPNNPKAPAHDLAVVALANNPERQFHTFTEVLFDTYEQADYARLNLFFYND